MSEEYLQAAFEIKAACDDISRKLLRWHWEEKPGAHSVDALLKHLAQRQKESPDYYERLPELNGRTGWQQLDTTPRLQRGTDGPQRGRPRLRQDRSRTGGDPVQRGRGGAGSGL